MFSRMMETRESRILSFGVFARLRWSLVRFVAFMGERNGSLQMDGGLCGSLVVMEIVSSHKLVANGNILVRGALEKI